MPALSAGQELFAIQITPDGVKSKESNWVKVISHTEVYPDGIPQPVLQVPPPLSCGRAIGVAPPIPSATVRIRSEAPTGPGTFAPPVEIGNLKDFPYAFVAPFTETHRITAQAEICNDKSALSPPEIVQASPTTLPAPTLAPARPKQDRLVVEGTAGPPPQPVQGTTLEIIDQTRPPGTERVGGQPTPGAARQQVLINPFFSPMGSYRASQALCASSPFGARPSPCRARICRRQKSGSRCPPTPRSK